MSKFGFSAVKMASLSFVVTVRKGVTGQQGAEVKGRRKASGNDTFRLTVACAWSMGVKKSINCSMGVLCQWKVVLAFQLFCWYSKAEYGTSFAARKIAS